MRKRITENLPATAVALLIAACMTGCASGSKIRSDIDRDADFNRYQTYNFNAILRDKTKVTTRAEIWHATVRCIAQFIDSKLRVRWRKL